MTSSFDVAVIGSGALGASTAFHLAKLGQSVALLDRAEIASQTSARAAGLTGQVRPTEAMTRLASRSVNKIERFTEETGQPITFYQPGSLTAVRLPEHVEMLRGRVALAKRLGIDMEFISLDEARQLNPFLKTEGVLAVTHSRKDLYLEPVQLPRGYALAAQSLGATLMPNTLVESIVVEQGAVTRLLTNSCEVRARIVVDAAGGWLRSVAALAGARMPVVPMRHQLMVTVSLPEVNNTQPVTRIVDANVYVRPDRGGLMFGGYETDPKSVDPSAQPNCFRVEDLELDMEVLRNLTRKVRQQFPIFQDVKIREHRGGLPTMTMDGEHVLGEVPGIAGLYVIGGCNVGGLSISPVLGEQLAELIVHRRSTFDLSIMAPSRFSDAVSESDLLAACTERYARYYTYRLMTEGHSATA